MSPTSRLPAWSTATVPHASRLARVAGPPSATGPRALVPAGVVSASVAGLTFRTAQRSATYRPPLPSDTPQADTPTLVARPGPPGLPARVEITPAGAAAPLTGTPGPAAGRARPSAAPIIAGTSTAAASTTSTPRAGP